MTRYSAEFSISRFAHYFDLIHLNSLTDLFSKR